MNTDAYTISGIKVNFPSKPYPSQMALMSKIINGLNKGQNCLLESPTGSGKTLALLCSTLAWQTQEKINVLKNIQNAQSQINHCKCKCSRIEESNKLAEKNSSKSRPGIKYEEKSPDESLITDDDSSLMTDDEPILELSSNESSPITNNCDCKCHQSKNDTTRYVVPKIYFASRTHKQISQVVKELRKTTYAKDVKMTILSSREHTCIHEDLIGESKKNEKCRELVKGKKDKITGEIIPSSQCSYYHLWKKTDDKDFLNDYCWDIEDLIDESRDRGYCPFYVSRDIAKQVDIVFCPYNYLIDPSIRSSMKLSLKDEIVILDEAHNIEDSCRTSTTFRTHMIEIDMTRSEITQALDLTTLNEHLQATLVYLLTFLDKLKSWITKQIDIIEQGSSLNIILSGPQMVKELESIDLRDDNFHTFQEYISYFTEEDHPNCRIDHSKSFLDRLCLMFSFLYKGNKRFSNDYKIIITKVYEHDFKKEGIITHPSRPVKQTILIDFLCLNPGVAFEYLKKCHSIILCSGTLSPLDTFQSELGVKFEHQLEANHVIAEEQVFVASIGYGPNNKNLLANYKNAETFAFQDEVGNIILDVCKKVPFGILCFLPSYSLLDKLYKRWEEIDLLKLIGRHKTVFTESSKGNQNFDKMLNDYYLCINNSDVNDTMNGALLMAVYRGRASEGLDFSDNYARTVIAVGIPYPNIKDLQVDLKRKYNNAFTRMKNILNGDMWYEIQASRAINQALGRCIRHKNDWGAILLVDDRFFSQSDKYSKGLSKWIRQKYKTFKDYNEVMQKLEEFIEKMNQFNKSTNQIKDNKNKYLSYKPVSNNHKRQSNETRTDDECDGVLSPSRMRKTYH